MWGLAAGSAVTFGAVLAHRIGLPIVPSTLAITLLALSVLLGSKAWYLTEAHFFPLDDYVPQEWRGAGHGFRIPGGILALAFAMPIVCRAFGLPWRRFGNALIPVAALALVFIHLGCFLNGCCFGRVSSLSWAVTFPPGSWVFWYHRTQGWIPANAAASLPVHPLQLYFVFTSIAVLVAVVLWRRFASQAGGAQILFYTLFFGTTAILELFRQNHLSLNVAVSSMTAVLLTAAVVLRQVSQGIAAARTPSFKSMISR
jgi:phosphatidylglycerol:prolipoprotein diacylglycerol transferase